MHDTFNERERALSVFPSGISNGEFGAAPRAPGGDGAGRGLPPLGHHRTRVARLLARLGLGAGGARPPGDCGRGRRPGPARIELRLPQSVRARGSRGDPARLPGDGAFALLCIRHRGDDVLRAPGACVDRTRTHRQVRGRLPRGERDGSHEPLPARQPSLSHPGADERGHSGGGAADPGHAFQ